MNRKQIISKEEKIGIIIRTIANNPGLTRDELLAKLQENKLAISLRSLSESIKELKCDYKLLPNNSKLKNGYYLDNIISIPKTDLSILTNALNSFAQHLRDEASIETYKRIVEYAKNHISNEAIHTMIRETNIIESNDIIVKHSKVIDKAISSKMSILVTYKSPRGQETKSTLFPMFKIFYIRAWYVICKLKDLNLFHPYRLDRFININLGNILNKKYKSDYKLATELLSHGWGMSFPDSKMKACEGREYVVIFDKSIAPYIVEGKLRHQNAKLRYLPNGNLEFSIKLSDPWEFCHWIRSFGSLAWFIKPKEIVDIEIKDLKNKVDRYN